MSNSDVLELSSTQEVLKGDFEIIDINTASLRKLVTIPGVGRALARRIIDNRPFSSLENFQQTCNIRESIWEKIKPWCTISITLDDEEEVQSQVAPIEDIPNLDSNEQAKTTQQQANETVSIIPFKEPPSKSDKPSERSPKPKNTSHANVWWLAVGTGFVVLLLSLFINLGILANINSGLRFVTPAEYNNLQREVENTNTQVQGLRSDADSLRKRMDNLQGLSGRMDSIETSHKELQGQLARSADDVQRTKQNIDDLSNQINELQIKVEEAQKQAILFDSFFTGLKDLLAKLAQ